MIPRAFFYFAWAGLLLCVLSCPGRGWAEETPRYGGRMIIGSLGEPINLISTLTSDAASHELASYFYIAPLRYNKDLEVECWAAESYEVLEGGRLLRFKLREGIIWEDGAPFTARDVDFTYRMMIDPSTPTAYAGDYKMVRDFRLTGDYSFEVRYDKPFARSLTTWMHDVLPQHLLEGADLQNTPLKWKPVSAGPYRLKSWERGSRITLAANPKYFEGRPYFDEVVYRFIPDLSTIFLEMKAHRLDMSSLTPLQYLRQTSGPDWDNYWRKYRYLGAGYMFLSYNLDHPFFKDVRVRRALSHAINCQDIIKGVLLGQGELTVGPYQPGSWVYNDSLRPYEYDLEKARQLLAEAGITDRDGDGILDAPAPDKDGKTVYRPFSFTLLVNQGNEERAKIAVIIQAQLKPLGIDVRIRAVEWAAFINDFVNPRHYESLLLSWNILADPDLSDVWHSSRAEPGGLNFMGFRNAEADRLLEAAAATLDQDARKALYDRFQEILYEEQPYTFLYVPYSLPIIQARIRGVSPAPAGIMHNFTWWWDSTARPSAQQPGQIQHGLPR